MKTRKTMLKSRIESLKYLYLVAKNTMEYVFTDPEMKDLKQDQKNAIYKKARKETLQNYKNEVDPFDDEIRYDFKYRTLKSILNEVWRHNDAEFPTEDVKVEIHKKAIDEIANEIGCSVEEKQNFYNSFIVDK